jgi:GTP-binding protein
MKFIDEAKIYVKAGDGGQGAVSFRREKFVPKGGPDGGDAGKGGDITFVADRRMTSLLDYRYKRRLIAPKGGHGEGALRHGRNGKNLKIKVPVGTVIKDFDTGEPLADLVANGQKFLCCKGGRGGKGNAHFATSTNQSPRYSQPGEEGVGRDVKLELKLLADVGIIGFPNVGKSTIISRISAAKPKVADYPFTTLVPNLGVVKFGDYGGIVVADIPGLIEGAHEGKGLGIRFLKHVERTRVLIHVLDLSPFSGREPEEDFVTINAELEKFDTGLSTRPQVVALNKTDITEAGERVDDLLKFFEPLGIKVFTISAVTGKGLDDLVNHVGTMVAIAAEEDAKAEAAEAAEIAAAEGAAAEGAAEVVESIETGEASEESETEQ